MGDSEDKGKVAKAAEAITELAKAVPVYGDLVQPAARELGEGLRIAAKAVNVALAPLKVMIWGYEKIEEFVVTRVAEKLEGVPAERIRPPDPHVAGPLLEGLRFTGHEKTLREMYGNLLATALDSASARAAHPAFVDIIGNMSPDEARICRVLATTDSVPLIDLRYMKEGEKEYQVWAENVTFLGKEAGCFCPDLACEYVNNLVRLGLVEVWSGTHIIGEGIYEEFEKLEEVGRAREKVEAAGLKGKVVVVKKVLHVTKLGRQFMNACVVEKKIREESKKSGMDEKGE